METLKFKTNIKCSGCVAASKPFLDKAVGQDKWNVNTADPDKILTVSNSDNLSSDAVIKAVENAGYKAEMIL